MRRLIFVFLSVCVVLGLSPARGEIQTGCFVGADATGQPARLRLTAERYGDYYEIFGQIATTSFGSLRIKADGWSGAGRMFRNHEGEAGAIYISISDFSAAGLMLQVDGYGSFPFRTIGC